MKLSMEEHFTRKDVLVLEEFSEEEVASFIESIKDLKEDSLMSESLKSLGSKCESLRDKLNLGDYGPIVPLGLELDPLDVDRMGSTFLTPTLICSLVGSYYHMERYCGGIFTQRFKDNVYLKMMLHFEDYLRMYHYIKKRCQ